VDIVAKQARESKGTAGRRNPIALVLGVVVVLGGGIVLWNAFRSVTDTTVRSPLELPALSAQELLELAQPTVIGNEAAAITIMDFSDFSCPSCQQFASRVKPLLDRGYIQEGLARFAYYDFPLPGFPNSFLAARAARCAGDQGGFWPFHDELFRNQSQWSVMADPSPTFEGFAEAGGLDRAAFRACLRSDRHAEVVTANRDLGIQLGVAGTPTIFLNTGEGRAIRVTEWGNVDEVRRILDEAIARVGGAAGQLTEEEGGR
jgi:protein-disulfide isomerase